MKAVLLASGFLLPPVPALILGKDSVLSVTRGAIYNRLDDSSQKNYYSSPEIDRVFHEFLTSMRTNQVFTTLASQERLLDAAHVIFGKLTVREFIETQRENPSVSGMHAIFLKEWLKGSFTLTLESYGEFLVVRNARQELQYRQKTTTEVYGQEPPCLIMKKLLDDLHKESFSQAQWIRTMWVVWLIAGSR